MSLVDVRHEIARYFRGLPKNNAVTVIEHGGPFNLEEIQRVAARAPALVVACLGIPSLEAQGSVVVAKAAWAVFCVAKDTRKEAKDIKGLLLAESVLVELPHQTTWNDTASKAPEAIAGANLYSSKLDDEGISLWACKWRQDVDLDRNTTLTFDDFETFFATYVIGDDDAPVTEDSTDLT
jgi:hypothetical protein